MADVIVTDSGGDTTPADSAHAAAVAEGMTEAHAGIAETAAGEAQAAAEAASAALEAQAEIAATAVQAAETAQTASDQTQATAEAMYELMQQQNTTLQALASRLLAEPEVEETAEPEVEETAGPAVPDTPPARKDPWYYRKMGKR